MVIPQGNVGPMTIKEIAPTIPSEISDRGLDGFVDSVFGVNTIYNGEGERSFVMKDGFPAVYYKGNPYRIESCDGRESVESSDGNRYFELADGLTYHCVVEVKKDSPSKGSVKVSVKSGEIEATEGYRIVTNQIICSTPLQDTSKRPEQFHTGTIDSIDDFEGKPPFSVEVVGESSGVKMYLWIPKRYSVCYKGVPVRIEESTMDGWYSPGGTIRQSLVNNSDYYFWFEVESDGGYTAHVGTQYPSAGVAITKVLHTYENGNYDSFQSGSISMSDLDLIDPQAKPFQISVNASPNDHDFTTFTKNYYIYVPDTVYNPSVVFGAVRVPMEFSATFVSSSIVDSLYHIDIGIACTGIVSVYKNSSGELRAKLHLDTEDPPQNVILSRNVFMLDSSAFTQDPVYKKDSIISLHTGVLALEEEAQGCFEALLRRSSTRSNEAKTYSLSNMYYTIGGKTYQMTSSQDISISGGEIVAFKVDMTQDQPEATIEKYQNLTELQNAQEEPQNIIRPILKFDNNGVVECDFRKMFSPDISSGSPSGSFHYDSAKHKIGGGCVMVGRTPVSVNGIENVTSGTYSVQIDFSSSGTVTATLVEGETYWFKGPTATRSYIPVYKIEDGVVTDDRRGGFCVPAHDNI